jgi:SAM-dependent methyltransferase
MTESFRPIAFGSSSGVLNRCLFQARLLLDLQAATIYRAVRKFAGGFSGSVLDVGCGASPFRFLFDQRGIKYNGLDIADSDKFDYHVPDVTTFNGRDIPFADNSFDGILCTEVLEHVQDYQALVDEMHRVLKPGGVALVTVPWSARFHYIPHDYFRYTPSTLATIFRKFARVEIAGRGTDVTSIVAKILVLWFRNLMPSKNVMNVIPFCLAALFTPVAILLAGLGHASFRIGLGSDDDPLGYTVLLAKQAQ